MAGSYREASVLFTGAQGENMQRIYLHRRTASCCSHFYVDSLSVSCYMVIIISKGGQEKAAEKK